MIQPSLDTQSLCTLHSDCAKKSNYAFKYVILWFYASILNTLSPGDDSWHLVSSAIVYVGPRTLQELFNMLTLKSMKTCWYMYQQMGKLCAYLLELNQNTISTKLHQKRNSTATHSELNLHTSFSGISYWLGLKYFLIFKLFQHEITN